MCLSPPKPPPAPPRMKPAPPVKAPAPPPEIPNVDRMDDEETEKQKLSGYVMPGKLTLTTLY